MSSLSALRSQRQTCADRIADTRAALTRCERAYESLSAFQTTLTQSQEDFTSVNRSKAAVLSQLEPLEKNSRTAQQYRAGMQEATQSIGVGTIGTMYMLLQTQVSVKLQEYAAQISAHEAAIAAGQSEIASLDRQMEAARRAETAKTTAKGGR